MKRAKLDGASVSNLKAAFDERPNTRITGAKKKEYVQKIDFKSTQSQPQSERMACQRSRPHARGRALRALKA